MLGRDGKTTVAPAEMPKLAYRCRQIAEEYSDGRLLSRDWKARAEALRVQIDRLLEGLLPLDRRNFSVPFPVSGGPLTVIHVRPPGLYDPFRFSLEI